jgi:hypothetical protein
MKRFLIIQGPMISEGRAGKLTPDMESVVFDTNHNVKYMIEKYGHLFDVVVLSTWTDEPVTFQTDEPYIVVRSKMPPRVETPYGKGNQDRQFYSLQIGLDVLHAEPTDIVVKTRTDITVDLESILFTTKLEYICVTHMNLSRILEKDMSMFGFAVGDFYFSSSYEKMRQFTDAMLVPVNLGWKVHQEMIMKYAYVNFPEFAHLRPVMWNSNEQIDDIQAQVFACMMDMAFYPHTAYPFLSMSWRGHKVDEKFIKDHSANSVIYKDRWDEHKERVKNQ